MLRQFKRTMLVKLAQGLQRWARVIASRVAAGERESSSQKFAEHRAGRVKQLDGFASRRASPPAHWVERVTERAPGLLHISHRAPDEADDADRAPSDVSSSFKQSDVSARRASTLAEPQAESLERLTPTEQHRGPEGPASSRQVTSPAEPESALRRSRGAASDDSSEAPRGRRRSARPRPMAGKEQTRSWRRPGLFQSYVREPVSGRSGAADERERVLAPASEHGSKTEVNRPARQAPSRARLSTLAQPAVPGAESSAPNAVSLEQRRPLALAAETSTPRRRSPGASAYAEASTARRRSTLSEPDVPFESDYGRDRSRHERYVEHTTQAVTEPRQSDREQTEPPAAPEALWPEFPDGPGASTQARAASRDRWPELPVDTWTMEMRTLSAESPDAAATVRGETERIRRLDLEQRGVPWNA